MSMPLVQGGRPFYDSTNSKHLGKSVELGYVDHKQVTAKL